MENSGHAFACKHFTPTCFSQFLSDREPFHGSFFNLHNQMRGPALCCDRQALLLQGSFEEEKLQEKLRKQSYQKVTETDTLQWESHSNPNLCHFACGCVCNDWCFVVFCLGFQNQFEMFWVWCVVMFVFICQTSAICNTQADLVACTAAAEACVAGWIFIHFLLWSRNCFL